MNDEYVPVPCYFGEHKINPDDANTYVGHTGWAKQRTRGGGLHYLADRSQMQVFACERHIEIEQARRVPELHPENVLVACFYCAREIDSEGSETWRAHVGFHHQRYSGVKNLSLNTLLPERACDECIQKRLRGIDPGQLSFG